MIHMKCRLVFSEKLKKKKKKESSAAVVIGALRVKMHLGVNKAYQGLTYIVYEYPQALLKDTLSNLKKIEKKILWI